MLRYIFMLSLNIYHILFSFGFIIFSTFLYLIICKNSFVYSNEILKTSTKFSYWHYEIAYFLAQFLTTFLHKISYEKRKYLFLEKLLCIVYYMQAKIFLLLLLLDSQSSREMHNTKDISLNMNIKNQIL